ncbi:MAG: aspartate aminotransferase family protein [Bacillota bacterium]
MKPSRLERLLSREEERFKKEHLESGRLFRRAWGSLLGGVPMPWMTQWAGAYPVFVKEATGARVTDVDGHTYVDLCLGDTGAMTGHAPPATVEAVARQAKKGITAMLPVEDAIWVAEELGRRFKVSYWQFALTATDANRFVLRMAREITHRPKVLVYNWCYHGTVDEALITLEDGVPVPREGNVGPPVNPAVTTRVIEWNDTDALEEALSHRDVACVLAEPAMTNIGIILPEPGYHDALRELTRRYGTLLVIDETHTICASPGGYTAAHGLSPDFVTIGKPIAGGVPAAAYGFTEEVASMVMKRRGEILDASDTGGIGGTLSGNALSIASIKATLSEVLTEEAFHHMIALGERFTEGVEGVIRETGAPWHVVRLGCRAEYRFQPGIPRNGREAAAARDSNLDRFMHLYALNRGILLTPFHNMALMCPVTSRGDVDFHTEVFREAAWELLG